MLYKQILSIHLKMLIQYYMRQVIRSSHGNIFTFGAIFQAVAQRFGIDCELKVFPNHLFLDWRNNDESSKPLYTVDLLTGELKQKRQCPFSTKSGFSETKYCPDSLLQYIYTSYMKTKSPIKNWYEFFFRFAVSH